MRKFAKLEIPKINIEGSLVDKLTVKVKSEGRELTLKETLLEKTESEYFNPLEAFLSGLVACEIIMYKMLFDGLGYTGDLDIKVKAEGEFKIGEGLDSLNIKYYVRGLEPEDAKAILELVKTYCPVLGTIKKANVKVHDELIVEQ